MEGVTSLESDVNVNNEFAKPVERESRVQKCCNKLKRGISVSLIVTIAVHLAMLIIGAINVNNCPVEKNIPVFLIVAGVIGIISKILGIIRNVVIKYVRISTIMSIVVTIELMYFILGSFWVFKEYTPRYIPSAGDLYCDKTTYIFAVVYISIVYVVLFCIILGLLCFVSGLYFCDRCLEEGENKHQKDQVTQTV